MSKTLLENSYHMEIKYLQNVIMVHNVNAEQNSKACCFKWFCFTLEVCYNYILLNNNTYYA